VAGINKRPDYYFARGSPAFKKIEIDKSIIITLKKMGLMRVLAFAIVYSASDPL